MEFDQVMKIHQFIWNKVLGEGWHMHLWWIYVRSNWIMSCKYIHSLEKMKGVESDIRSGALGERENV